MLFDVRIGPTLYIVVVVNLLRLHGQLVACHGDLEGVLKCSLGFHGGPGARIHAQITVQPHDHQFDNAGLLEEASKDLLAQGVGEVWMVGSSFVYTTFDQMVKPLKCDILPDCKRRQCVYKRLPSPKSMALVKGGACQHPSRVVDGIEPL